MGSTIIVDPYRFDVGGISWSNDWYTPITIQGSFFASDVDNFPFMWALPHMPAGFWSNVTSNNRDIRATLDDGTTEIPISMETWNHGTSDGLGRVLIPRVTASTNLTFRVYYGNSGLSAVPVTDPYGRNAIWAAYERVLPLHDCGSPTTDTDLTGNGNDGTYTSTSHTYESTYWIGCRSQASGANNGLNMPDFNLTDVFTLGMWSQLGLTATNYGYGGITTLDGAGGASGGDGPVNQAHLVRVSGNMMFWIRGASGGLTQLSMSTASAGIPQLYTLEMNGTAAAAQKDLNARQTATIAAAFATSGAQKCHWHRYDHTGYFFNSGGFGKHFFIYPGIMTTAYRKALFDNVRNRATFYTVGSHTAA